MPALCDGCWFWIDESVPEHQRCMSVMCQDCKTKSQHKIGSYYDFKNGVGTWDIVCDECKTVLWKHEPPEDEVLDDLDRVFDEYFGGDNEK